jgi:5-methylcytosine-specific restriction endonuclease McrA
MLITPCRIKKSTNVFCSKTCQGAWSSENHRGDNNPAWRGGKTEYYGPNWKKQRKLAIERDTHKCRMCGIDQSELYRKLDVHHIVRFMSFGLDRYEEANRLDNLISLCPSCHAKVEGKVNVEQYRKSKKSSSRSVEGKAQDRTQLENSPSR